MYLKLLITCLLWVSSYAIFAQDDGLLLHIPFDTDAGDISAKQRHGTLKGATIVNERKVGKGAVYLDGKDDYISFPVGVYFAGNYTISLWSKILDDQPWTRLMDFNQDKPASGSAVTWLLGRKDTGKNNMWFDQWVVQDGTPIESIVDFDPTNPADAYLGYDLVINEWQHYVITYKHDALKKLWFPTNTNGITVPLQGEVTLYVDGKKASISHFCLNPQPNPTTSNWLGRSLYEADPYYHGYLDDFRIYNKVLSTEEITQLFQLGK